MVGIYGTGGIGKTAIARAIYNLIADQFDGVCFLADVRDNSVKGGLAQLQQTMLSKIIGEKDTTLTDAWEGSSIIKRRLAKKRILLILDDVDHLDQLERLAGKLDWFGLGSRIIITTRNEHLLRCHGVERKYEVKTLNNKEAHELFTWHAFKSTDFDRSYLDVLNNLVLYCSGLPLALEVIGSNLFGKSLDEWQSALHTYKIVPEKSIQQTLKISYDDLGAIEKDLFLDLACLFKGYKLEYAQNVFFSRHGFLPQKSTRELIDRSLIRIDPCNIVWMHDLIEDMGKETVRNESPNLNKRSRLWLFKDILQVFQENTGTEKIEAIVMHSNGGTEVQWDGNGLMKMTNLQILIIKNVSFTMGPKYLPSTLRYLEWKEYRWQTLPFKFYPEKLAILSLEGNCLASFKSLLNLKLLSQINLSGSKFLDRVPDLTGISNLKELLLDYCPNLIEVHSSVGNLVKLRRVSAFGCRNLKYLPEAIKSTSLVCLRLSRCSSLESVPDMPGITEKITKIYLHRYWGGIFNCGRFCLGSKVIGTPGSSKDLELDIGRRTLPIAEKIIGGLGHIRECEINGSNFTIGYHSTWLPCCTRVEQLDIFCNDSMYLSLSSWFPRFANLEVLYLKRERTRGENARAWRPSRSFVQKFNKFADKFVLTCLHWMPKLQELDLSYVHFTILPECINKCHFLRILILDYCRELQEIRGMPSNIEYLSARECTSLSAQSQSIILSQTLHKASTKKCLLPGITIPEWFDYRQSTARSLSFWVRKKFPERIILSFVGSEDIDFDLLVDGIHCEKIKRRSIYDVYLSRARPKIYDSRSFGDVPHVCLLHVRIRNEELIGDRWSRIEFSGSKKGAVSCMGVHVFNNGKNSRDNVRFTDPHPGKSKVNKDMGNINSNYHPLLKNWYSFLNMNFFSSIHFPYSDMGKLWKIQALAKVKMLMRQIAAGDLPTCHYLFRRKLIKSPLCPICETKYETLRHVFLCCPWTRAVWFGCDSRQKFRHSIDSEANNKEHSRRMGIVANIRWAIWKGRNEHVLKGKPVDPALAVLRVRTLCNQYSHSDPLGLKIIYKSFSEIAYQGQVKGSENKGKGKSIMERRNEGPTELWSEHAESECDSTITNLYDDEDQLSSDWTSESNASNVEADQWSSDWMSESSESSDEAEVTESDNEVEAKRIAGTCNDISEVNDGGEAREGDSDISEVSDEEEEVREGDNDQAVWERIFWGM